MTDEPITIVRKRIGSLALELGNEKFMYRDIAQALLETTLLLLLKKKIVTSIRMPAITAASAWRTVLSSINSIFYVYP
jgi:hypothetical protein